MIQVFIEVEAGCRERQLYNEKTLEYRGTRETAHAYPYPYGFIPGTSAADDDCVDCYVITRQPVKAGKIVDCEALGLVEQDEREEVDHKVLAGLASEDPEMGEVLRTELEEFIQTLFARFPDVIVRVGRVLPPEAALDHIEACREHPDGEPRSVHSG